jgi:hypothetical protein
MSLKSWTVFRINTVKNKRRQKLKKGTKEIVIKTLHNSQLSLQNTGNVVILQKYLLKFESGSEKYIFEWYTKQKKTYEISSIRNVVNVGWTK